MKISITKTTRWPAALYYYRKQLCPAAVRAFPNSSLPSVLHRTKRRFLISHTSQTAQAVLARLGASPPSVWRNDAKMIEAKLPPIQNLRTASLDSLVSLFPEASKSHWSSQSPKWSIFSRPRSPGRHALGVGAQADSTAWSALGQFLLGSHFCHFYK